MLSSTIHGVELFAEACRRKIEMKITFKEHKDLLGGIEVQSSDWN